MREPPLDAEGSPKPSFFGNGARAAAVTGVGDGYGQCAHHVRSGDTKAAYTHAESDRFGLADAGPAECGHQNQVLRWRPRGSASVAALPVSFVAGAAEVAGHRFGAIFDDSHNELGAVLIQVDSLAPLSWSEVSRHEYWADEGGSAQTLGSYIDRYRCHMPTSTENLPDVVVNLPCRDGMRCLYLSPTGVALATELFDAPGDLIPNMERWPTFAAALYELTLEV